jgi:hypothetical protein
MRLIDLRDTSRECACVDREPHPLPQRVNGRVCNRITQAKVIDNDVHDADPIAVRATPAQGSFVNSMSFSSGGSTERHVAGSWRSPWKTASTLFPSGSMTNAA